MKNTVITILIIASATFAVGWYFGQSGHGNILETIDSRKTTRAFSDKEIDDKTMNEIMWAAFGKNSRGTRTIPTAKNNQNLKVYAIRADGAFL